MFLETLLTATIGAGISLLIDAGFGDAAHDLRDQLAKTAERKRIQALQDAYQEVVKSFKAEPDFLDLLRHRPFEKEVVKGLLDIRGLDFEEVASLWGKDYPQYSTHLILFFNQLQLTLLKDEIWRPILSAYKQLRLQKDIQVALKEHSLPVSDRDLVEQLLASGAFERHPGVEAEAGGIVIGQSENDTIIINGEGGRVVQYFIQHYHESKLPPPPASLRRRYLEDTARSADLLPWANLGLEASDPDNGKMLALSDIYTDLDTTSLEGVRCEEDLRKFYVDIGEKKRVSAQEMLNREKKLLILGDPGTGKSTFLKHIAYLLSRDCVHQNNVEEPVTFLQPWSWGCMLPLRLELRYLAAYMTDVKTSGADLITRFIRHSLEEKELGAFWEELDTNLRQEDGEAMLILLDGLDEAPRESRQRLVEAVNAFTKMYPKHHYVITSRPYAYYDQEWKLEGFTQVTLAPFNEAQIDHFIECWYEKLTARNRRPPQEAKNAADGLKEAVRQRGLLGLAERPLLLTVMTQLHAFEGKLPEERTELYDEAVKMLLQKWERRLDPENSLLTYLQMPELRLSDLLAGFYEVAYKAHTSSPVELPTADIDEAQLRAWLAPYLGGSYDKAGEMVTYIRERAGLLIRHKSNAFTFPHRTFQEFLAACYLVVGQHDYPSLAASLVRGDPVRWREVFILAAGYAARTQRLGGAVASVNALLPLGPDEEGITQEDWDLARIAGEALLEIGLVGVQRENQGRAQYKRTRHWLLVSMHADDRVHAENRAEAGRLLSRLGDPRPEVLQVDAIQFCYVPAGPFLMGSRKEKDKNADQDERQHRVCLPTYWIAHFPVTNAQFRTFILDDGYRVDKFWMEAREAGVWQDGKVKDRIDEDWRDRPYSFGGVFEYDNYPVIGVNWYEALAFTRWLDMRWTGCGLLKKDWRVILPSEAEWEKAARGGLELPEVVAKPCNLMSITDLSDHVRMVKNPLGERIYPWGDKLDPNRLNMNETGIRITSSVGCFPGGSSPYGTEEMSGNTWEWTRSLYLPYPYKPGDGREDLSASRDHDRVQRGGSFYDIERFVRCAYRFRYYPDRRGTNTGFRVVVSPPSTSDL